MYIHIVCVLFVVRNHDDISCKNTNGVSVEIYLDGLPSDVARLADSTLRRLRESRGDSYDALTDRQQRPFDELATLCLQHIAQNPDESSVLFGKRGPNEEAYGMNLLEVDGAILRMHFYSTEGAETVQPSKFQDGLIDVNRFGTPHNHTGNIAAVVPHGELVHHAFKVTRGEEYTAGKISYVQHTDATQRDKLRQSVFTPTGGANLEYISTAPFNANTGYRMGREAVHVVTWPEPTVTLFVIDLQNRHQCTVFQQAGVIEEIERPRALSDEERTHAWDAFIRLIAA